MTPLDPIVEALVNRLDANWLEEFEERAGILQFEASHSRELAEPLALLNVLHTNPLALVQAQCLLMRWAGKPVYLLASTGATWEGATAALGDQGGTPLDLSLALGELGGAALLTPLKPLTKK
jgi:hypothetical protein